MTEGDNKVILVIGGAKSGKTAFALKIAGCRPGKKAYIATAEALDREMEERIEKHKAQRGKDWDTYEEPVRIAEVMERIDGGYEAVVIDCLTLWMSNLLHHNADIDRESGKLTAILKEMANTHETYLISNEVGMGIVPDNELSRRFRDCAGTLNQQVAAVADEVYLIAAGLPLRIK